MLGNRTHMQPHGEHDRRAQNQAGDEPMGDRQDEHRRLLAGNPERREAREICADAECQLQTEERQQQTRQRRGDGVARPARARGEHRQDGEHGDGAADVQPEPAGVGQQRAEHDLGVDQRRPHEGETAQAAVHRGRGLRGRRGQVRERGDEREKGLCERPVHQRELIAQQHHAQAAERALCDHRGDRDETEGAQRGATAPERGGEGQRQQADRRAEQAVAVLVEHTADHAGPWIEEEIVPERVGPVRDGERRPGVGHQAAEHDQDGGGDRRPERQTMSEPHTLLRARVSGGAAPRPRPAPATAAESPRARPDRCTRRAPGTRSERGHPS